MMKTYKLFSMNLKNKEYINIDIMDYLIIFTDGSCKNNGKDDAKAGIGIYFPCGEYSNFGEKFENKPTNQRAELYAIYKALDIIKDTKVKHIRIYSDSMYAIQCLTVWIDSWIKNKWIASGKTKVKNKDIIEPTYNLLQKFKDVQFVHVRAHTKADTLEAIFNDRVDKIAQSVAN